MDLEQLKRLYPGEYIPRTPETPVTCDLQYFDIAWYRHTDNHWYPALVTGRARSRHSGYYAGKKLWYGVTLGLFDPMKPNEKCQVMLCPMSGNAKPDTEYTRLLLQVYGKINPDSAIIARMVADFRRSVGLLD